MTGHSRKRWALGAALLLVSAPAWSQSFPAATGLPTASNQREDTPGVIGSPKFDGRRDTDPGYVKIHSRGGLVCVQLEYRSSGYGQECRPAEDWQRLGLATDGVRSKIIPYQLAERLIRD